MLVFPSEDTNLLLKHSHALQGVAALVGHGTRQQLPKFGLVVEAAGLELEVRALYFSFAARGLKRRISAHEHIFVQTLRFALVSFVEHAFSALY